MVKLSERMKAVAALVTSGGVLADVGTDHGYVPIALVAGGKVRRAIAMDINRGPLERAARNIAANNLGGRIETRLSDGVAALFEGEADSILIAGMGGELTLHILADGEAVCRSAKELILQPQSDIRRVREYLRLHRYKMVDEDMVCEDEKYYPMLRAVSVTCMDTPGEADGVAQAACDIYGPILLRRANPVLRDYLAWHRRQLADLFSRLKGKPCSDAIEKRVRQVQEELLYNESAYAILGEKNAGI